MDLERRAGALSASGLLPAQVVEQLVSEGATELDARLALRRVHQRWEDISRECACDPTVWAAMQLMSHYQRCLADGDNRTAANVLATYAKMAVGQRVRVEGDTALRLLPTTPQEAEERMKALLDGTSSTITAK